MDNNISWTDVAAAGSEVLICVNVDVFRLTGIAILTKLLIGSQNEHFLNNNFIVKYYAAEF